MKHAFRVQLALAAVFGMGNVAAQDAAIGAPQDWSSRAVVHRQVLTPDEFRAAGRSHELQAFYRDPRYVAAVLRQIESEAPPAMRMGRSPALAMAVQGAFPGRGRERHLPLPTTGNAGPLLRDWSNVLGGGGSGLGGSGTPGVFPAKYSFDISAAPNCLEDFVVYTTDAAGRSASAGSAESYSITLSSSSPAVGTTITIGRPGIRQVVLTASSSSNTGLNFQIGQTNSTQRAQNLRNAVNRWTGQTGFRAGGTSNNVVITSDTFGFTWNNAVVSSTSNLSVSKTNGSGTPGQPTILAFNQLYQDPAGGTGCKGNWNAQGQVKAPKLMWAYNTGDGFRTETSPVLSYLDGGKQVAFVQRNGDQMQLVLLKWKEDQGTAGNPAGSPDVQIAASAADYRACSDNCYFAIKFNGTSNSGSGRTYSSPFVDYGNDILWAGDGNGRLHKFTGVFQGLPAEVTTGGFPATVAAGMKLSPPVYAMGNVYVGSQSGANTVGGRLHRVDAANGTVTSSAKLALANTTGLRESPIVDASLGQVYVFVFNDRTSAYTDASLCNSYSNETDGCRAVFQFPTAFAESSAGSSQQIGRGNSTTRALYAGGFDDAFYTSADGTGAMYIVGGQPGNSFYSTMWKIPISAGALQKPERGAQIGARDRYVDPDARNPTDNTQSISPVTVIKNGNSEYVYASVASFGNAAGCGDGTYAGGACLYMFDLSDLNGSQSGTPTAWGQNNRPSAGLEVPGGTGGIVVDNVRPEAGASQIYFSHTATTGNAVQVSQDTLE